MASELRLVVPLQDSPFVENERITLPWSRFLTTMAALVGGSVTPVTDPVVIRQIGGGFLGAFDAVTGELLGVIPLENQPGGAVQVVAVGPSPHVYHANSDGTLVVFSAEAELSRDGGVHWYTVTLTGGAIPMKKGDWVRATWFSTTVPKLTWFPTYAI